MQLGLIHRLIKEMSKHNIDLWGFQDSARWPLGSLHSSFNLEQNTNLKAIKHSVESLKHAHSLEKGEVNTKTETDVIR